VSGAIGSVVSWRDWRNSKSNRSFWRSFTVKADLVFGAMVGGLMALDHSHILWKRNLDIFQLSNLGAEAISVMIILFLLADLLRHEIYALFLNKEGNLKAAFDARMNQYSNVNQRIPNHVV
jgi:hypothetical protein